MSELPLIKPPSYLQTSDILSGLIRSVYYEAYTPNKIGMNVLEMAVYKTLGRIIGDSYSVAQLSGSETSIRRIVDKEIGKKIEEDIGVFIVSSLDAQLRKKQSCYEAIKNGLYDAFVSYGSRYLMENTFGGDEDVLTFVKSLNPINLTEKKSAESSG